MNAPQPYRSAEIRTGQHNRTARLRQRRQHRTGRSLSTASGSILAPFSRFHSRIPRGPPAPSSERPFAVIATRDRSDGPPSARGALPVGQSSDPRPAPRRRRPRSAAAFRRRADSTRRSPVPGPGGRTSPREAAPAADARPGMGIRCPRPAAAGDRDPARHQAIVGVEVVEQVPRRQRRANGSGKSDRRKPSATRRRPRCPDRAGPARTVQRPGRPMPRPQRHAEPNAEPHTDWETRPPWPT